MSFALRRKKVGLGNSSVFAMISVVIVVVKTAVSLEIIAVSHF